jgi:FMN phosphatase YigB (HAD superfamily)
LPGFIHFCEMEISHDFQELLAGVKNIIFDFGGVIINIDYDRTIQGFRELGLLDVDKLYSKLSQESLFDLFETGKISGEEFFTGLESYFPVKPERSALENAWNAMLLDFPRENMDLLHEVKNHYRTFLLSNTNQVHLDHYFQKLQSQYHLRNMDEFFEKTYYSHLINRRKPGVETFLYVLEDSGVKAEDTFFIDDSPQHVEGALKAGLKAYHLKPSEKIGEIFLNF